MINSEPKNNPDNNRQELIDQFKAYEVFKYIGNWGIDEDTLKTMNYDDIQVYFKSGLIERCKRDGYLAYYNMSEDDLDKMSTLEIKKLIDDYNKWIKTNQNNEHVNHNIFTNTSAGGAKQESGKLKNIQIKNLGKTKEYDLSDWDIVDFNKQEVWKDVLLRDVDLDDQGVTQNCYAYVAAALLRSFAKKNKIPQLQKVQAYNLLNEYGVTEESISAIDTLNTEEPYQGSLVDQYNKDMKIPYGNYIYDNDAQLGKKFNEIKKLMHDNKAMSITDIVESIHALSEGKAALNVKTFTHEWGKDFEDGTKKSFKEMIKYVLEEKQQPVGLLPVEVGKEGGHYLLVIGLTSNGFKYKDSKVYDKKEDNTTVREMTWDDLFSKYKERLQLSFIEGTDEKQKHPDYYEDTSKMHQDDARVVQKDDLFNPENYDTHSDFTDVYYYDNGKQSYFNLRPKKKP